MSDFRSYTSHTSQKSGSRCKEKLEAQRQHYESVLQTYEVECNERMKALQIEYGHNISMLQKDLSDMRRQYEEIKETNRRMNMERQVEKGVLERYAQEISEKSLGIDRLNERMNKLTETKNSEIAYIESLAEKRILSQKKSVDEIIALKQKACDDAVQEARDEVQSLKSTMKTRFNEEVGRLQLRHDERCKTMQDEFDKRVKGLQCDVAGLRARNNELDETKKNVERNCQLQLDNNHQLISQLKKEIHECRANASLLEKEHKTDVDNVKLKYKKQCDNMESVCNKAIEEKNELQKEFESLQKAYIEINSTHTSEVRDLRRIISKLNTDHGDAIKEQIKGTERFRNEYQNVSIDLQEKLKKSEEERANLGLRLRMLQEKSDKEIQDLKRSLKTITDKHTEVSKTLSIKLSELTNQENDNLAQLRRNETLTKQINVYKSQRDKLESDMDIYTNRCQFLSKELTHIQEQYKVILEASKTSDENILIQDLRDEINRLNSDLSKSIETRETQSLVIVQNNALKNSNVLLKEKLKMKNTETDNLNRQIEGLSVQLNDFKKKIDTASAAHDSIKQDKFEAENQLRRLRVKFNEMEEDYTKLKGAQSQRIDRSSQYEVKCVQLESKLVEVHTALSRLRKEKNNTDRDMEKLQLDFNGMITERENQTKLIANYKTSLETIRAQYSQLKTSYDEIKSQLANELETNTQVRRKLEDMIQAKNTDIDKLNVDKGVNDGIVEKYNDIQKKHRATVASLKSVQIELDSLRGQYDKNLSIIKQENTQLQALVKQYIDKVAKRDTDNRALHAELKIMNRYEKQVRMLEGQLVNMEAIVTNYEHCDKERSKYTIMCNTLTKENEKMKLRLSEQQRIILDLHDTKSVLLQVQMAYKKLMNDYKDASSRGDIHKDDLLKYQNEAVELKNTNKRLSEKYRKLVETNNILQIKLDKVNADHIEEIGTCKHLENSLRDDVRLLTTHRDELLKRINCVDDLSERKKTLETTIKQLKGDLDSSITKNNQSKQEREVLLQEYNEYKEHVNKQRFDLMKEREKFIKDMERHIQANDLLKIEVQELRMALESNLSQIKTHEERITKLRRENGGMLETCENYKELVDIHDELSRKYEDIKRYHEITIVDLNSVQKELRRYKHCGVENEELKARIAEQEETIKELAEKSDKSSGLSSKQANVFAVQITQQRDTIKLLENDVNEYKRRISLQESQISVMEQTENDLKIKLSNLNEMVSKNKDNMTQYVPISQYDKLVQNMDILQRQNATMEVEIGRLKSTNCDNKTKNQLADLENNLRLKDELIMRLSNELEKYKNNTKHVEKQLRDIQTIEQDLHKSKQNARELEEIIEKYKKSIENLNVKSKQLRDTYTLTNKQNEELDRVVKTLNEQLEAQQIQHEKTIQELCLEISKKDEHIDKIKDTMRQSTLKGKKVKTDIQQIQLRYDELNQKYEETMNTLKHRVDEISILQGKLELKDEHISKLKERMSTATLKGKRLTTELKDLEEKNKALESQQNKE